MKNRIPNTVPSFLFTAAMVAVWCTLGLARADVRIDGTFASHMVLQREKPIAVQGSAARNEEVTVEFAGQKKTAKADAKEKWQVALDPLEASKEPQTMVGRGGKGDYPASGRDDPRRAGTLR